MTPQQLKLIMPFAASRADLYAPLLDSTMSEFEIDTPKRKAAFIAQIAHESGSLKYVEEIASGEAYEGRKDLGNTQPGDGKRFKGRGFMQITGRANYQACGEALGLDLIASPELLQEPVNAARSAGWYWHSRNLNRFADWDQFGALTRAINGGYIGLDDRIKFWLIARKVFGL